MVVLVVHIPIMMETLLPVFVAQALDVVPMVTNVVMEYVKNQTRSIRAVLLAINVKEMDGLDVVVTTKMNHWVVVTMISVVHSAVITVVISIAIVKQPAAMVKFVRTIHLKVMEY